MCIHSHICLCMHIHIQMCTHSIFISVNIHLHALISNPTPRDPSSFFLSRFVMRMVVSIRHSEYTPFLTSAQSLLSGPSLPTCDRSLSCRGPLHGPLLIPSQCVGVIFSLFQLNIPCQVTPQQEHVFNPLDSPTYHTVAICFSPLSTKTQAKPPLCHCKLTPVRLSHTYSFRRQRD